MRTLLSMLLLTASAFASTTTLTGLITDSQGNPLNGTLVMQLPVPAQDPSGSTAISPVPVYFRLVNGQVTGGAKLFDVLTINPAGLYYTARAYDAMGFLQFYGNYVVTGATFNIGAAVPTAVTTSNISYLSPAFVNGNNSFTGANAFTNSGNTFVGTFFQSGSSNPAASGVLRLANGDQSCWRNAGNSADLCLSINGAGQMFWPGDFFIGTTLAGTPANFQPQANGQTTGNTLTLIGGLGNTHSGGINITGGAGNGLNNGNGGAITVSGGNGGGSGNGGSVTIAGGGGTVPGQINLSSNTAIAAHFNQSVTGKIAGTCAMSTSTTCTFTLAVAFTSAPICIATAQGSSAIAAACGVSSTTVTITAASSNSLTWGALLIGNPN